MARVSPRRIAWLIAALGVACHKSAPPAPNVPAREPPVPAPEGRLADVVVATPNSSWARIQRGVGGALGILPATFGGLACATASLDLGLAPEIDGNAPAFGVIAKAPDGELGWALAVKLVDPRHAESVLAEGDTARFVAKPAGSIVVLAPKGSPGPAAAVTVGIARAGYLLVARNEDDLGRLGPYAYRTLPTLALPASAVAVDLPHDALAGALHDALARAWTGFRDDALKKDADLRAKHGGREPDFGDPLAIVSSADGAVQKLLALEGDLGSAHVAFDPRDDRLEATVTLEPSAGEGPASRAFGAMHPGDAAPMRSLPEGISVGLLFREDIATRAEDGAAEEAALVAALGTRLHPDDAKRLHAAIEDWEAGRGDTMTAAITLTRPTSVVVRTPAADAARATKGVRAAVDLLSVPALRDPLRTFLSTGDLKVTSSSIAGLGPVMTATTTRDVPGDKARQTGASLGLAWAVVEGELRLAAAEEAQGVLAATLASPKTLGEDPRVATALGALGTNATFALVAPPVAAPGNSAANAPRSAPIVFGWGRSGASGWAHLEMGDMVARDLVHRYVGL